jgi:hypothetical protein
MLKISTIERPNQCRLVVEGKLVAPWTTELKLACERARAELRGRKLVVYIRNLVTISQEGENVLFGLMNDGVVLRGSGLFTKHILRQLAQTRRNGNTTREDR